MAFLFSGFYQKNVNRSDVPNITRIFTICLLCNEAIIMKVMPEKSVSM